MIKAILKKIYLRHLMKDEFNSLKLREYFQRTHNIKIGLYSYGCFDLKRIPKGTTIGRYCSFSPTSAIFSGNHGLTYLTLHPYIYDPALGFVTSEKIKRNHCIVEDDVWFGHNSIITPSVTRVGRGSVIAAGAVVTKDVPRYAIVAGNPAKVIKYRFDDELIEKIENSKWWKMDNLSLKQLMNSKPDKVYFPSDFFSNNSD